MIQAKDGAPCRRLGVGEGLGEKQVLWAFLVLMGRRKEQAIDELKGVA